MPEDSSNSVSVLEWEFSISVFVITCLCSTFGESMYVIILCIETSVFSVFWIELFSSALRVCNNKEKVATTKIATLFFFS